MTFKTILASIAVISCLSGASLSAQAQTPATKTVQAEHTNVKYKIGDTAHDLYKDERVGVKDWQDKGLTAPTAGSQWVQISEKYALIEMDNGKILDIQPGTLPVKK